MPKNRWHQLPYDVMYRFKEYRFDDMAPIDYIIEKFSGEEIRKITDPDSFGRKRKRTAQQVNTEIVRAAWEIIIDRLMESETLLIDKDLSLYIGREYTTRKNKIERRSRKISAINRNFNYQIVLNGVFHNYKFRMPFRRRKELANRIKSGQNFIQ